MTRAIPLLGRAAEVAVSAGQRPGRDRNYCQGSFAGPPGSYSASMSITTRDDRPLATEMKFRITTELGDAIGAWARGRLSPDPYAGGANGDGYTTTTLYFDSAAFDVFRRRGSYGRSKYRVRRYGASDMVFLERKMRTRDRLSKRRTLVPATAMDRLAAPDGHKWAGSWFERRLEARGLAPVCGIRYQRLARVAQAAAGPIRLTIDRDIAAWSTTGFSLLHPAEVLPLLETTVILELKFTAEPPALFKQLVQQFNLEPVRSSKYRTAVEALGLAQDAASPEEISCPTS